MDADRRRQVLGDAMYGHVFSRYPRLAGKLTGMLLQLDEQELVQVLDDAPKRTRLMDEANEVLRQHMLRNP